MTTSTNNRSNLFYNGIAAFGMIATTGLLCAAGTFPEGLQRGAFIVSGFGVVLEIFAAALVLRAAYTLGFGKASKSAGSGRNHSVTA